MSALMFSQAAANSFTVNSHDNIENVINNGCQMEDNCEEDIIKNNTDISCYIMCKTTLFSSSSPSIISISSFIWQPPE
jgi:hypothetical protein